LTCRLFPTIHNWSFLSCASVQAENEFDLQNEGVIWVFSTLAGTLNRDFHFDLSPLTLCHLECSGGDDGARTRDLCRDS
jgi:hypothetical protein